MATISGELYAMPSPVGRAAGGQDSTLLLEQRVIALTEELARLRNERAVQLAEKQALASRLRNVLDGLPAAVVVLDGSGVITEYNRAATALFSGALLGIAWRDVIVRDFQPLSQHNHDLILKTGRIVALSTCPLGAAPGQILLFEDVTDMRRAQDALARQQRILDLGQMAANIAHQIRTPLASALLYVSHLDRSDLAVDVQQRFAEKAVRSLRQLENLVANMLLFARGEIGNEQVMKADDLLRELHASTAALFSGTAVQYTVESVCATAAIRVNRTMMLSALQNLVSNAAQSVGATGQVTLYCQCTAANSVDLGIRDDGPGVAPDIQEHLFTPFSTTRDAGTGLGLAIVRAIARAHHGEVWFESNPGNTTFAVRLPAVAAQGDSGDVAEHERDEVA